MIKKSVAAAASLILIILLICPIFTVNAETFGSFAQTVLNAEKGKSATAEYTVKSASPIIEIYINKITPSSASVQCTGVSAPSGWTVKNNSVKPEKSGAKEVTLKFEFNISGDAPSGETVTVDTVATVSSETEKDCRLNAAVSIKIPADAAAAANENEPQPSLLSSLSVENGTLSPAFSPNNFIYSVKVPYEVTNLAVTAVSDDKAANITVENTELAENGVTAVIVTVISAAGRQIYRINAERKARIQSGNTNLSSLTAEGFTLSPPFSNDVTEYVIWVPYETEKVNIAAAAEDASATVDIKLPETLKAGEYNDAAVSVTAENGGKKEFTVHIKRAAEGEGLGEADKKSENGTKKENTVTAKDTAGSGNVRLRYAIIGFAAGIVLSTAAVFAVKSGLFAKAAAAITKKEFPQTVDEDVTFTDGDGSIADTDTIDGGTADDGGTERNSEKP